VETFLRAGSQLEQARVSDVLCGHRAVVCPDSKSACLIEWSACCVSLGQRHSEWSVIQKWPLSCQPTLACDSSESAAPTAGRADPAVCGDSHGVTSHLHIGRSDSRTFLIVRYRVRSKPPIVIVRAS
jgi:hypothetical protein